MSATPESVLRLANVGKAYGAGRSVVSVLNGVDLDVQRGEYVAIIGPSGSGKSTLLNILGCLDRPSSGQYLFTDQDTAALDDRQLSRLRNRQIGFVFQSFQLVPHLTVAENVELPLFYSRVRRSQRHRRRGGLIDRVGLSHRSTHLPSELSGGECQRVAIARALANDPALLLADEPTGNLDSHTSAEIMTLFHELHGAGATVVMITHDQSVARAAPRRVALRDGRVESDQRGVPVPEGAAR